MHFRLWHVIRKCVHTSIPSITRSDLKLLKSKFYHVVRSRKMGDISVQSV